MKSKILLPSDRKILWLLQNQPDLPVESASKLLKVTSSKIHYSINKLKEMGVMRRIPVISVQAIGFYQFDILFSLAPTTIEKREQLISYLVKNEYTSRIIEVGAEFEYRMLLLAKTPSDCLNFIDQLGKKFGIIFANKQIFITTSYVGFGRKYLTGNTVKSEIRLESKSGATIIDPIDHGILRQISANLWLSNRDHAKALGLNSSTFAYRIKNLESKGIFNGYILGIKPEMIGRLNFQLLLQTCSSSSNFSESLEKFGKQHDLIVNMVQYLGPWDYSIQIEPEEARQVVDVMRDLQKKFPDEVRRILPVPHFKILKNINYPFQKFQF